MPENKRDYRQNHASQGLVFLGGKELEIKIKNISMTGLSAELVENEHIYNIKNIFTAIKLSPIIDIYLPEMNLEGEVEVVRVDIDKGDIFLALEFKNISYHTDNTLYKRKAYRKNMATPGQIVFNGKKYDFITKNISLSGVVIHLQANLDVPQGRKTIFDFKHLKLRGVIQVVWVNHLADKTTLMGLHYERLQKNSIVGVPNFTKEST